MLLRPRRALAAAAGGVALLVLAWLLAFHVGVFRHADQSVYVGFNDLSRRGAIARVATHVATLCNPNPYVYLAAIPLLLALLRRRYALAVAIGAILLGANATTELLKPLLAQPRAASLFGGVAPIGPASWPSGHATAAMSWALCMILATPPRRRPVAAALGAVLAVAVCYSFLVLGWHYPSDVLGGYLVAAIWTLIGVAALRAARRAPTRDGRETDELEPSLPAALTLPAAALTLALGLAGLIAVARPHEVADYARAHSVFVIGAAGIGALTLALATGMVLALRR
jgi:membrane-associated phospholipid phosphatase